MKQFKILQITNILIAFALTSSLFTNAAHSQDIFSSQFTPGPGVKNKGNYVLLKGPDVNFIELSWVEYSRPDSDPIHVFVEARKEITGDGKDPILQLNNTEKTITSANWHLYSFGIHSGESIKIFFTNDQWIRGVMDVNVSIRKLILKKAAKVDTLYSDSVTVSWDANTEPDLAGYQIRYGNAPRQYTQTINVINTTVKELNLEREKMYYLVVSAYDSAQNFSNFSDEVVFYIFDEVNDTSGGKVAVDTLFTDSVTVSWKPNSEADLKGYRIHWGTASRQYPDSLEVVGKVEEKKLSLEKEKMYYLAVTAYDTANNRSSFSNEITFYLSGKEMKPQRTCDIDGDGLINRWDWFSLNRMLGSKRGDTLYKEVADFNDDGVIDQEDKKLAEASCMAVWFDGSSN